MAFWCCHVAFGFVCGCRGFCHRTKSDLSLLLDKEHNSLPGEQLDALISSHLPLQPHEASPPHSESGIMHPVSVAQLSLTVKDDRSSET